MGFSVNASKRAAARASNADLQSMYVSLIEQNNKLTAERDSALTQNAELSRENFEKYCLSQNWDIGHMKINGQFHHYMDSDIDNMWIGFKIAQFTLKQLRAGKETK